MGFGVWEGLQWIGNGCERNVFCQMTALIINKYKNRRLGGPQPDTLKLVKNYKVEDPDGARKIIEKSYPKRAPKLENHQKNIPEA